MRSSLLAVALAVCSCAALGAETKYEPTWESLDKRPTPEWFQAARFGIAVHWGVYSVPAWAPTGHHAVQYWKEMQSKKGPTWEHHLKAYGADFQYERFAPRFKAEKFKPEAWADLFARAGARYVVLTARHHDGFCLWPSAQAKGWHSAEVGPKRDLLGDLAKAVRVRGLKMGLYYSLLDWRSPLYRSDAQRYAKEHVLPQLEELVQRDKPSLLLADGAADHPAELWGSEAFLAWLFNESACRAEVVVNDRWGKGCRGTHGGCYTSAYGDQAGKLGPGHVWQEGQAIGRSFGYNRNEGPGDYKTAAQLIQLLVDCVSRGGNLLLSVGPDADGTIPQIMQDRLLEVGKWLKVNGESIYGAGAGPLKKLPWGRCTARPGKLLLHVFEWPKGELEVPGLQASVVDAWLLADPDRSPLLLGRSREGALTVTVPRKAPDPIDSVVVLEIEGQPRVAAPAKPVLQAPEGGVLLHAREATVHGRRARYEKGGGKDNIGFWSDVNDWVSWTFDLKTPGTFAVEITAACARGGGGSEYDLIVGGQTLKGKVKETGSWTRFTTERLGTITLERPAQYTLSVKPRTKPGGAVMNLKSVVLRPTRK